ncbi:antibiotic biosynthesis monooxygenase, partial [Pseudonocardia lacus]|uniref:antibiotic biosynthesis monooxygenase n=1 Tax=Pseudonocardia lacus TaxID=2835865 RepID=UPI001BDD2B2E
MAERGVTISVSYPVAAGEEAEFEAWSRLRLAESADRPGYLGGQVLAPPAPGPDWFIVHRFENERAASSWETWFRDSPGWQQAGDIEWKVDGGDPAPNGRPAGNGRPPNGRVPAPRTPDPRTPDGRGRPVPRPPAVA